MYARRSFKLFMLLLVLIYVYAPTAQGQTTLTVTTDKPVTPIQPTMWGIFFEDINFGADGGLYAELIKNRSFEFSTPLMGWKDLKQEGSQGTALIENGAAKNEHNPRYARITVN